MRPSFRPLRGVWLLWGVGAVRRSSRSGGLRGWQTLWVVEELDVHHSLLPRQMRVGRRFHRSASRSASCASFSAPPQAQGAARSLGRRGLGSRAGWASQGTMGRPLRAFLSGTRIGGWQGRRIGAGGWCRRCSMPITAQPVRDQVPSARRPPTRYFDASSSWEHKTWEPHDARS